MVVQGVCEICLSEGVIEKHHIISRSKIESLETGQHGSDLDLMKNPRNIITLCIPCHELTDSHHFRRWALAQARKRETPEDKKKRKKRNAKKRKRSKLLREKRWASGEFFRCSGMIKGGKRRCLITIEEEGFCTTHWRQIPKPDMED
jgi:hypothetical protein